MSQMHPQFIKSIEHIPGLFEALTSSEPTVSIRLNPRKSVANAATPATAAEDCVPWCKDGLYLAHRPKFTLDPAMHQGLYYVQDASSMFITEAIRQIINNLPSNRPLKYLDACAAPGGKTTAAISSLPDGSLVVANEFDTRRSQILVENVSKWGYPNCIVTRGDTAKYKSLTSEFDIIAVDAPCSGEGMMRKEAVAVEQWTPQLVGQCAECQREILENIIPSLRPGGYLIYSTCTFNNIENECIVDWLIENYDFEKVNLNIDSTWGIVATAQGYHFYPSHLKGEGLFISVLRSTSAYYDTPRKKIRDSSSTKGAKLHPLQPWITDSEEFILEESDGQVIALPKAYYSDILRYRKALNIVYQGINVATIKGRDYIPAQPLATSTALNTNIFPAVDIDLDTALSYLRREAIALPYGTPRGFVLLTYGCNPLGWVKNLGNRANNLYPDPWRIRH